VCVHVPCYLWVIHSQPGLEAGQLHHVVTVDLVSTTKLGGTRTQAGKQEVHSQLQCVAWYSG